MRRIALINQKGGVGKTTSTVNLGAALALEGRRVVVVDLDPQANLSLHLDVQLHSGEPSSYTVLLGNGTVETALRDTKTKGLRLLAANIDLSGAELELSNAFGREMILRDALEQWEQRHREAHGEAPADYVLLDCPPSLGLLSVNGLVAAHEAVVVVQTEFFALQGMTKLVDVVQLLRRRLNPKLEIAAILPCLYDNRTKLAREVLGELRAHFPGKVFTRAVAKNVKLAEAPSYGQTIFEYAPESSGASDYRALARELIAMEARDSELFARYGVPAPAQPVAEPVQAPGESMVTLKPTPPRRQKRQKPASEVEQPPRANEALDALAVGASAAPGEAPRAGSANDAQPDPQELAARAEATRSAASPSPASSSAPETLASTETATTTPPPAPGAKTTVVSTPQQPAPPVEELEELPDLPPETEFLPRYVDL